MNDTGKSASKMVRALVESKGHPFTVGYLEVFMTDIIQRYVKDENELTLLKIEMLAIACDQLLDKMENAR